MGPMTVVEPFELSQGVEQVALIPDQGAAEKFVAAGKRSTVTGAHSQHKI
jgi:hypothetical protein